MDKSQLTRACYEHKLDKVRALIAAGAPVDASDNGVWRGEAEGCLDGAPYYTPLGEACRSGYGAVAVQSQIVAALLDAGAPVDQLNYRNETAFHFACQGGRAEIIRQVAAAGADITRVGCLGNGVDALVNSHSPDEPGSHKVAGLQAILELGVDPRRPGAFGRGFVENTGDYTGNLVSRSRGDKVRGRAMLELMELVGERYPQWVELSDWLERHRAAHLKGDAKARKAKERIDKLRASVGGAGFEKKAVRALGKKAEGRFDDLRRLTNGLLMAPEVVAHEAWPRLVRALLELTVSYGDLTEDSYGVRLTVDQMDDDEGGALDFYGDERLSTAEHCLVACRARGAAGREDYTALVREIFDTKVERIGHMSFGDEEAVALIAHLDELGHPEAAELREHARRCFPFAPW